MFCDLIGPTESVFLSLYETFEIKPRENLNGISHFKTSQHKETQIHQKKMQWSSLRCEVTTMFHAILIFPTSAELNEFGYESWEARQLNIFCTLIKTKLNVKTEVIS